MRATRRASQRRAEIIIICVMLVIGVIFVLPYIWMLLDSFKPMKEIIKMMPYVVTVAVLIFISIRNKRENMPPASLGTSYFREDR